MEKFDHTRDLLNVCHVVIRQAVSPANTDQSAPSACPYTWLRSNQLARIKLEMH